MVMRQKDLLHAMTIATMTDYHSTPVRHNVGHRSDDAANHRIQRMTTGSGW
jgi:hypothetical protein